MQTELFQLKEIFSVPQNKNIKSYSRNHNDSIVLLVPETGDELWIFTQNSLVTIIPWFIAPQLAVLTTSFCPDSDILLLVTKDGSLFLLNSLALISTKEFRIRKAIFPLEIILKEKTLTCISHCSESRCNSSCALVWNGIESHSYALIGTEKGSLILFDLISGLEINVLQISDVKLIQLEVLLSDEALHILITDECKTQWRLILEEDYHKSETDKDDFGLIAGLKQMSLSLRQRFSDNKSRKNGIFVKELEPLNLKVGNYYISLQRTNENGEESLIIAGVNKDGHLTLFTTELLPLSSTFEIHSETQKYLLSLYVILYVFDDRKLEISSRIESKFPLQFFSLSDEEVILGLYTSFNSNSQYFNSVNVISNKGLSTLFLKSDPSNAFRNSLSLEDDNIAKAIGKIFNLSTSQLFEEEGDAQLRKGEIYRAYALYSSAQMSSLRTALKIASLPYLVNELHQYLLSFLSTTSSFNNLVLIDRCHVSNMFLLTLFHESLTSSSTKDFKEFKDLKAFMISNPYFEESLAIHCGILTREWKLLEGFCSERGLFFQMIESLMTELTRESFSETKTYDFLNTMTSNNKKDFCLLLLNSSNFTAVAHRESLSLKFLQVLSSTLSSFELKELKALLHCISPYSSSYAPVLKNSSLSSLSITLFISALLLYISKKRKKKRRDFWNQSTNFPRNFSVRSDDKSPMMMMMTNVIKIKGYKILCAGSSHAFFLTKEGNLFGWGLSVLCGSESQNAFQVRGVTLIEFFADKTLVSISAGAQHSLALTNYGVYSWGTSAHGQLGHGNRQSQRTPKLILGCKNIVAIATGQYHSLALDKEGKVWSWGLGVMGQLGLGSIEDFLSPQRIFVLKNEFVTQIDGGVGHSLVLLSSGVVMTFGSNHFGQLGIEKGFKSLTPIPVEIPLCQNDERVIQITCGLFHNLLLTSKNRIFKFGENPIVFRSESRKYPSKTIYEQILISTEFPGKIIDFAAGNSHSLLLTDLGTLYSFGGNIEGQLGLNSRLETMVPTQILALKDDKITHLAAGSDFSLALSESGTLFAWGTNGFGQLGIRPLENSHGLRHRNRNGSSLANSCDVPKPLLGIKNTNTTNNNNISVYSENHYELVPFLERSRNFEFITTPKSRVKKPRELLIFTLEYFAPFYSSNSEALIKKSLMTDNVDIGAKIAFLSGQIRLAFELSLQAMNKSKEGLLPQLVFKTFMMYLKESPKKNERKESSRKILLERLIDCWNEQKWSFLTLEKLCWNENNFILLETLVLTLFCPYNSKENESYPLSRTGCKIVDFFTPEFCLKIGDVFVKEFRESNSHVSVDSNDPKNLSLVLSSLIEKNDE